MRCEACAFREEALAYADLPSPYYEVVARGVHLWAWNRGHFTMLLDLLEGRSVDSHPYAWNATYARREWVLKKNRTRLARAIRRAWPDLP